MARRAAPPNWTRASRRFIDEVVLPVLHASGARAGAAAPAGRRPGRHRHRDQRLRHAADRRAVRRRRADRDRTRSATRPAASPGAIRGVPAFREGKVDARASSGWRARAAAWRDFERSTFYSDSTNDLPLLERVSHPVATNPAPALERIAAERGWPITQTVRMIKKFIDRLLGKGRRPPTAAEPVVPLGKRVEVPAAEHGIDPALLDERAVRVVRTLKDAGHEAYIVGGAVRDLLVGLRPEGLRRRHRRHARAGQGAVPPRLHHRPALPHRARGLRPRPRARGRSRSRPSAPTSTPPRPTRSAATRRPVEAASSAARRTSSTPAAACCATTSGARRSRTRRGATSPSTRMYYDPADADRRRLPRRPAGCASKRVLRMIGDPATRYREDPVRIIRVVRFAAKLGFAHRAGDAQADRQMAPLLANVPLSRLFDEMIKLLQTGHALASIDELRKQGLQRGVFPMLDVVLRPGEPSSGARQFVAAGAGRHRPARRRRPRGGAELPAGLPAVARRAASAGSAQRAARRARRSRRCSRRSTRCSTRASATSRAAASWRADMREIWLMQPRFERRTASSPHALVEQPRFRAGYDFLRLRADCRRGRRRSWPTGGKTSRSATTTSARPCCRRRAKRSARSARRRAAAAGAAAEPAADADGATRRQPSGEPAPATTDAGGAAQAPAPARGAGGGAGDAAPQPSEP